MTRVLGLMHALMSTCLIPKSISFATLNGFPKLDLDIVMKLVKFYNTFLETTLIPLVMESSEGGKKQNCELVPKSRFGTLTSNVALLRRIWRKTKYYHNWMRRKKWNRSEHIEKWRPSTSGPCYLSIEDYLSQSISSNSSKNSFLGRTRYL